MLNVDPPTTGLYTTHWHLDKKMLLDAIPDKIVWYHAAEQTSLSRSKNSHTTWLYKLTLTHIATGHYSPHHLRDRGDKARDNKGENERVRKCCEKEKRKYKRGRETDNQEIKEEEILTEGAERLHPFHTSHIPHKCKTDNQPIPIHRWRQQRSA